MNRYRILIGVALIGTVLAWSPSARAEMLGQTLHVTFSGPVEVPGTVLPAGSYIFESLDSGHLTRIMSADQSRVYGTLFTIPEQRSQGADKAAVQLEEGSAGVPQKVEAWFCPGNYIGNEFIYDRTQAK